jgi:Protein of unknown function (DUF3311)
VDNDTAPPRSEYSWWYALLVIPFIAVLWVPFYASTAPELWGFPFFYWYQILWILITGALTAVVYRATR